MRGNQRGACEAGASPDLLPGCAALDDAEAAGRVAEAWGGVPCRERGLDATEMVAAARGLVVVAEDLTAALPAGVQALAAAGASSFLVVLEAFVTPTTAAATVVLPIAAFAENEGTVTNLEGRVQRVRPAVYPPGQARPGWAVLAEICRRLGAAAGYGSVDDVRRELGRVVPAYAALREVELDLGWGAMLTPPRSPRGLPPDGVARATVAPRAPLVAAVEEAFDWGRDPHVRYSPTLCREAVARRRLYPRGVVAMGKDELGRLGVRPGWPVRIASAAGEVVVPVVLRSDLGAGVVMVPAAGREALLPVLGTLSAVDVTVTRA